MNRSLGACITVVVVTSLTLFWLPTILVFDLPHIIAGFLAGRVGGTAAKGVVSGLVGGLVVALVWIVALFGLDALTLGEAIVTILWIPFFTTLFGAIGGWTGKTFASPARRAIPEE